MEKKNVIAIIFAVVLLSGCINMSHAAEVSVSQQWEISGFDLPESVIYDESRNVLYVSNVSGYISKVSLEGSIVELKWIQNLNGPKGMAIVGDTLYVSDMTDLAAIDLISGTIAQRYPGEGAVFLNDAAADADGRVFVTDSSDDKIYLLSDGTFTVWLSSPNLNNPNGIKAEDGRLVIACWGASGPAQVITVSLDDKTITNFGSDRPIGNLDGLEPDGFGNYFVTEYSAGILYHITPDGTLTELANKGTAIADLTFIPSKNILVLPLLSDGRLVSYNAEFITPVKTWNQY